MLYNDAMYRNPQYLKYPPTNPVHHVIIPRHLEKVEGYEVCLEVVRLALVTFDHHHLTPQLRRNPRQDNWVRRQPSGEGAGADRREEGCRVLGEGKCDQLAHPAPATVSRRSHRPPAALPKDTAVWLQPHS